MPTDSTATVADVQLTDEVHAFCQRHHLLDHLGRAIKLARQHSGCRRSRGSARTGPRGRRMVPGASSHRQGRGEHAYIQAHMAYNRSWANSTRWPAVQMITLLSDLIEE